jgi:ribosomal protein L24
MTDLTEGTILRAELTGKRYRVVSIDYKTDEIRVEGLRSVSLTEVQQDIDAGKLTVVR